MLIRRVIVTGCGGPTTPGSAQVVVAFGSLDVCYTTRGVTSNTDVKMKGGTGAVNIAWCSASPGV